MLVWMELGRDILISPLHAPHEVRATVSSKGIVGHDKDPSLSNVCFSRTSVNICNDEKRLISILLGYNFKTTEAGGIVRKSRAVRGCPTMILWVRKNKH